ARALDRPCQRIKRTEFLGRKLDIHRVGSLFQTLDAGSAGNGNYVLALGKHPGEGNLRRRCPFRLCECTDTLDDVEIFCKVLRCKTWQRPAEVVGWKVACRAQLAGQKPTTQRAVWHERYA